MKFETLKNYFSNNKVKKVTLISLAFLIWFGVVFLTINHYSNVLGKESDGSSVYTEVIEVNKDTKITQEISFVKESDSLAVKYATYARKNKGNLHLTVKGKDSGFVYVDKTENISILQDNAFVTYSYAKGYETKKDAKLVVEISSDSESGSSAGVWFTDEQYFENSKLTINKTTDEKELIVHYLLPNQKYSSFSTAVIALSAIGFSIVVALLAFTNVKKEYLFSSIVLICGLAFMVIMSMGALPDEILHYEHALSFSNVVLKEDRDTIDSSLVNYDSFADHSNVSFTYNRMFRDFDKSLEYTGKRIECDPTVDGVYFVQYLPQTIAVTICRLFKASMIKTYLSGRFANLMFYTICVFIAIKNTPTRKMLIGVIATLPIFVQQAASYSYDTFINGMVLISVSYLFKWLSEDKKVSVKDIVTVFLVSLLLSPAKIVYGLFTLLFWLVPTNRFGSFKNKILVLLFLCAPTIGQVLYNIYIRIEGTFTLNYLEDTHTISLGNNGVFYSDSPTSGSGKLFNVVYILEHPIETIELVLRTVRFYLSTWFYQSLGRSLSGNNLVVPMTNIRIILILIGVTALRKGEFNFSILTKLSYIAVCLMIAAFVLVTMLTGWTYRDDTMIVGVQGRYFCPLLPYFFSIFGNKYVQITDKLDKPVIFTVVCNLFFIIVYILAYTFVN